MSVVLVDTELSVEDQVRFVPPYCPRLSCPRHHCANGKWYGNDGWRKTKRAPGLNRKYLCGTCGRGFSYSSFHLEYWQKRAGLNKTIFAGASNSMSNRQIALLIGISEHAVRGRLAKMSRWTLLRHAEFLNALQIKEPIVIDGIENFAFSQYDPNDTHHAVGKGSLFIYDFNIAPLNRRGRMTESQRERLAQIEEEHGRYDTRAVQKTFAELVRRLAAKLPPGKQLVLFTDEHAQYRRAIERDLCHLAIVHRTTSSKARRTALNPLFPVNHFDLLHRHQLAAFRRETIAFAKHTIGMIDKTILLTGFTNYMRPQFTKPLKKNPARNTTSPAMALGLTKKILSFERFFDLRRSSARVPLNADWKGFFGRRHAASRVTIAPYSGYKVDARALHSPLLPLPRASLTAHGN